MKEAMAKFYPEAHRYCEEKGLNLVRPPFCAYEKTDMKRDVFQVVMGLCPEVGPSSDSPFEAYSTQGGKYLRVVLLGAYDHLESAWYSAFSHLRMAKLKFDQSLPSFEFYESDPRATPAKDLKTSILIAVK